MILFRFIITNCKPGWQIIDFRAQPGILEAMAGLERCDVVGNRLSV